MPIDGSTALWLEIAIRVLIAAYIGVAAWLTVRILQRAGIDAAHTGQCTYADEGLFFSYRRTTHRSEPDYGRQISAIVLRD